MADKKQKNKTPKKQLKPVTSSKRQLVTEHTAFGQTMAEVGYTAKIRLPDGRTLAMSPTGLSDVKNMNSRIVLDSKEQAQLVATNLAKAYGRGAKPAIGRVKKKQGDK